MNDQPLHTACDTIHAKILKLEGMEQNLNSMQIVTVYKQLISVKSGLEAILSMLREKALRDEGERYI